MVFLPTEILTQILDDVKTARGTRLAPLACVNRQWQAVVEKSLWKALRITSDDADDFKSHFQSGSPRRPTLRQLVIDFDDLFSDMPDIEHSSERTDSDLEDCDDEPNIDEMASETVIERAGAEGKNNQWLPVQENKEQNDKDESIEEWDNDGNDNDDEDSHSDDDSEDYEGTQVQDLNESDSSDDDSEDSEETQVLDLDESDSRYSEDNPRPEYLLESTSMIKMRHALFQNEHKQFFQAIRSIWNELYSWKSDLNVYDIYIYIEGNCIYTLLGSSFRHADVVEKYLWSDTILSQYGLSGLPVLSSVTRFEVSSSHDVGLWPAIVACQIGSQLSNLESLCITDSDWVKTSCFVRGRFRRVLSDALSRLPQSLRHLELSLQFSYNLNHQVNPPSFLTNGVDIFSRTISDFSTQLTTLAFNANHLSPDVFWNSAIPFTNTSSQVNWPNLTELVIRTGFETAGGYYCMRGSDMSLDYLPIQWDSDYSDQYSDEDDMDEEERLGRRFGDIPTRTYRNRPKPKYFNALAISIARAVACMPKLVSLSLELDCLHRNSCSETSYRGWGFHFRAGNDARHPNTHFLEIEQYPGIDRRKLERPRAEWVFQCPFVQVQWEEPEEAQSLWRKKFNDIELDLVTCECPDRWARRRDGVVVSM